VSSTRGSSSIHFAKRSGPSSSSFCFVPGAGSDNDAMGKRASVSRSGRARFFTSALPLTITSPTKFSTRVARSRRRGQRNSSGVSSMNFVV
jgi:hypothetical protein